MTSFQPFDKLPPNMGVFMNKILIICITVLISGCNQQVSFGERVAKKHLAEANKKIESFLVILEDPIADKDDQEYVLCLSYPKIYKYELVPAMLKLSKLKLLEIQSKDKLLGDFKLITDNYSKKLGVTCD
ncbi:hypothetical protein MMP66_17025 [Acinetobacter dispersus]|uniref:hypothetical protein n=1 Tax=Acinetobacter dispersus TaxID=70348 RepID=UPI001F4BC019|nr:hypothetical protein [Acinetobacter dispersus]MCH7395956.1 hypothetical protein [Acinetobacter dispersus]